MMKESDIDKIVKKILNEQYNFLNTGSPNQTIPQSQINKHNQAVKKYYCVPPSFAPSLDKLIKKGYNKQILKIALGIIGRESSFASGLRYNITSPLKTMASFLGVDTSVGPGQMKKSTAKDLKLKQSVDTIEGALNGVYQFLKRSLALASTIGYSDTAKSVNVPHNNSLNANTDIAIASYNSGIGKIKKYCETKNPKRKTPCDKINNKQVKNYLPNFPTKRWDGVDISTHGYVKEVVNRYKKFNCF